MNNGSIVKGQEKSKEQAILESGLSEGEYDTATKQMEQLFKKLPNLDHLVIETETSQVFVNPVQISWIEIKQ
jgi:hypothetical protein